VKILSGVFDGVTTGTPIQLLIENNRPSVEGLSQHRRPLPPRPRPITLTGKNTGVRDYRGGVEASARETASRVAAGAIRAQDSRLWVTIRGALVQIGPHPIGPAAPGDWRAVEGQPVLVPGRREGRSSGPTILDSVRKAGSSAGAVIEIVASGVPAGLGEPVYR